ncbi:MAG TPA: hypothetical protein VH092_31565 [Urbifossiella sp.]|jgi:hypothetical protein|nr:hypothetical protein [Urbifossiella sp.]
MTRLCVAAGFLCVAAGLARGQDDTEKAKEKKAELGAKTLIAACEAY